MQSILSQNYPPKIKNRGQEPKGRKATGKGRSVAVKSYIRKGKDAKEFSLSAVYTLPEAAVILRRSTATIRKLAAMGRLRYQKDGGGYLFSGWALKDYAEGRVVV